MPVKTFESLMKLLAKKGKRLRECKYILNTLIEFKIKEIRQNDTRDSVFTEKDKIEMDFLYDDITEAIMQFNPVTPAVSGESNK